MRPLARVALLLAMAGCAILGCKSRNAVVSSARSGAAPVEILPASPAEDDAKTCWQDQRIQVVFNPTLDPRLEPVPTRNGEQDRIDAMQLAVETWNAVLAGVGATQQLDLTPVAEEVGPFASIPEKRKDSCLDNQAPGRLVYKFDWTPIGPLVMSSATGPAPFEAPEGLGPKAGWTYQPIDQSDSIDALGVTLTIGKPIAQAGITFLTHMMPRDGKTCERIPWLYPPMRDIPRNTYDYYSVALHEIGHALGLAHFADNCATPDGGPNVMRPFLFKGQRVGIGECEIRELTRLYGPGGACNLVLGD